MSRDEADTPTPEPNEERTEPNPPFVFGFCYELLSRLTWGAAASDPSWHLREAEILEQAAAELLTTGRKLRQRALALLQTNLPLKGTHSANGHEPIDVDAFRRCFPEFPAERASDVFAIYEYVRWLAPSLELHPAILRQEIRAHLNAPEFPIERAFALLRLEEDIRKHTRDASSERDSWFIDEHLRARIVTLGLLQAAQRGLLPRVTAVPAKRAHLSIVDTDDKEPS
jgi:hypothetical protein